MGGSRAACERQSPIKKNEETEITVCGLFGGVVGTTVGQSLSCCT